MSVSIFNSGQARLTLKDLNEHANKASDLIAKVSSGQKITSTQDNASAYAISERMRVYIRSLAQDNQNVQNGVTMLKIGGGG